MPYTHIVGDASEIAGTNVADLPLAALRQTSLYGFANDETNSPDGIRYTVPLILRVQGKLYPSLALQIVCQLLNVDPDHVEINIGKYVKLENPFGKTWTIPMDKSGKYTINYRRSESFKTMSLYQLFSDLGAAEKTHIMPKESNIDKKVLLIGQAAVGLTDLGPSPYEGRSSATPNPPGYCK